MSRVGGGKYRIIAHLRGGEGTETSLVAVEAKEPTEGGLAVLKRLKLGADAEPHMLERFAVEARLCKLLDHPNLAKLVEAGQDEGAPVLVFEYLEGVSLARLRSRAVRQKGGVPRAIALRIVAEIAQGLAHAHALVGEDKKPLKLVHRDVSPENVTVTYDGRVKLSDFGMATTVQSTKASREDRVKGNVAYMAPEQARSEFSLDARADLFALGAILWELLTGKRLWEGLSEVAVLARLGDDTPLASARSHVPDLPEEVDALCNQALAKVRDERFDSAADFLEALQKVVKKTGLHATAVEVGAFVTALFEDERAKMRTLVEEARLTPAGEDKPLPAVGTPRAPDASPFVDVESDPKLRFGVAKPEEMPVKRVVEIVQIPSPSSDNRFAYGLTAAAVVVLGVAGIVAVTSPKEEKKVDAAPYVAPTRPTNATPEPGASAYKEPEEVTVDIRVTPPAAKLFVDGVKVDNPHRTRVVPAKFQHEVRAEAENFETRSMSVAFDKDRSIEIALTPLPPKPFPIRHPGPAKPPPPAPSPSASSAPAPAPPPPPPPPNE